MRINVTSMVGFLGNPGLHVTIDDSPFTEWCYLCPDGQVVCWPNRCGRIIGDHGLMPVKTHTMTLAGDVDSEFEAAVVGMRKLSEEEPRRDGEIEVYFEAVVGHRLQLRSALVVPRLRFWESCICCPDGDRHCGNPPRCPNPFAALERVLFSSFALQQGGLSTDFLLEQFQLLQPVLEAPEPRCVNRLAEVAALLPDHEWRFEE